MTTREARNEYQRNYYKNNKAKIKSRHRSYEIKNREKIQAYKAEYRQTHRDESAKQRERNWRLKYYYDIDIEKYNELFDSQNGCCAVCGKHQSELKVSLCVDHNHETGKVRGLLCKKCNHALGLVDEDVAIMKKMIDYMEKEF